VDGNKSLAGVLGELIADEPGFALAGCATSGDAALRLADRCDVDVALVDERLDDALSTEVLHGLRERCPDAVLLVWSYDTVHTVVEDADGVLERGMTFREVVRSVRAVLRARRSSSVA
jgi:DNA-binding NarL/FixJ family response regulator